ncbi:MAG: ABC transporter ATP-binding protein [Candidatus Heimdallarchaeota archaeon]|nr:ABC transporter ATP-binding protein [Candidatus Heimdallarchaeota archaeon]MCK4612241.1 ABC transporter ATP-binding protein [Candidatus Heimdallarchaeota archaeon]
MSKEDEFKKSYDRQYSDIELLKRFWRYLKVYKKYLLFIIVGILATAVVTILPPSMVQSAFEALADRTNPFPQAIDFMPTSLFLWKFQINLWRAVYPYAIGYVLLSLFLWLAQVLLGIIVTIVSQKIIKRIQMETYESLQEHDLRYFDTQSTGQIMSRITNDSQELNDMINVVSQFVANFFILFAVLIWMFVINWRLTFITLGMAPFVFIVAFFFRRITRLTTGKWRASIGEVNASFQESVAGISVAKAFGREKKSKEEFEVINQATFYHAKKRAFAVMGIWPLMDGISTIGVFGITLYGSWLFFGSLASSDVILLFLLLLNRFLYPLVRVASQFSIIQSGFAAMERIFSIVDAKKEITNPANPVSKELQGQITFEDVFHQYVQGELVLNNINLKIQPGESVAVVGHTGAGKTTIASLLMRFYDIFKGSIKIDGVDIRDYDLHNLRSQIGLVSQDVFLFSGTVLDNIRYGSPEASLSQVQEVINIVSAQEFIDALPDGLETELGERGKGLSAGQRQMVSFARTLLTDPKILILDEATAAVDAYTEWKIQEALDKLLADRTSIVIAHRLTTIKNSDRIIVLDQGKIVEEGDHEGLMKEKGLYSELYETYFKHQSAEWIAEISDVFTD